MVERYRSKLRGPLADRIDLMIDVTRPDPQVTIEGAEGMSSAELRDYDSLDAVASRLRKNNPRLRSDFADWLAPHWSRRNAAGRWEILGDPAHKQVNPQLYRKEEVLACWAKITAPVLWVEGDETDVTKWWGDRFPRADFESRLEVVPALQRHLLSPCGHMLHHDQPEALATRIAGHLDEPAGG